jgi:putative ABC transport system ATP-binding protein
VTAMPASSPIVALRDVRRDYALGAERVHALQGVTLDVEAADYVAIVGPSGCGKSTLLNLIGVIDQPSSGTVAIAGRRVDEMSDREATQFRLRNIGFVFQRFYLMPILSALENVVLPMAEAKVSKEERVARAAKLLEYVGLGNRQRHRPSELSGGEQQRVAIARALANGPALLLADEPTGELDAATGHEILELFRRLNGDGTTLVVVTHDDRLAAEAGRVIHMLDGTIRD